MRGWFDQAVGGLPRQFWLLWTGTLINRLGSFVVIFLAIYLTADRHFTQSQAGLVIGLYGVGGALGTTLGGVLADRWGRKPTMLTAQFGAAALMLALGFAHDYGQILAATFTLGLFSEAVRPAFSAMMVDIVPEKDRVRAFSLNYWAINLGFALSAVGAGLAAKVDYLLLFVVDAGSTLITALICLIFLHETRPAVRSPSRGRRDSGGMITALRDRVFMAYLLVSLLGIVVMMQHMSTLPIAMTAEGLSAATYGWVIAVNGVLIVLGQLFVPRLIGGRSPSRVLALGSLIIGLGFGLTAFAHASWFFALSVVIWTLGEMIQSPSNATTVAALSPASMRGRYQGLNSLSWSAGTALAPIAGGLTQEHLGNTALWLGCFLVCALAAAGHLVAGPSRQRRMRQLASAFEHPAPEPLPAAEPLPVAAGSEPPPAGDRAA
ncbi:MDR family MFS transporter [Paractinoplanes brasiliensis]|uniref:Putative MFS family arabinose efflux permease n=1 Tax=Paractinoplanes brasiliensis TaxID=52695 RepID=A0A4R6JW09_9ACTN|nr:MFS transporter [Actinoplanes brasiliensis]TDO40052.1 putative MFS family arabinose efflux permease [Actinoplanes brasiliensis]GID25117.1 MFS transporter [Actinoplanes brasiliensis]